MEAAKNIFGLQSGWQKAGTDCPSLGRNEGEVFIKTEPANSCQPGGEAGQS